MFQSIITLVMLTIQSSFVQQLNALHDYLLYIEAFGGRNLATAQKGKEKELILTSTSETEADTAGCDSNGDNAILSPPEETVDHSDPSEELPDNQPPVRPPPPGLDGVSKFDNLMMLTQVRDNDLYKLHNNIRNPGLSATAENVLSQIVDVVSNALPFRVDHVVKGGQIRKEIAIAGVTNVECVFFLQFVPQDGHYKWLQPLLQAVAGVLKSQIDSAQLGVEDVDVTSDSVQLRINGIVVVDLRFSPLFDSYRSMVSVLSRQGHRAHSFFRASLVKQRTQFIAKQSERVKVTLRLLLWWRNQQVWSSDRTRPSDELLEAIAVHSARESPPSNKQSEIQRVMEHLVLFDNSRIVFSDYYSENDICPQLLPQRPLLMDPTNPCVNLADPRYFDPSELIAYASDMLLAEQQ